MTGFGFQEFQYGFGFKINRHVDVSKSSATVGFGVPQEPTQSLGFAVGAAVGEPLGDRGGRSERAAFIPAPFTIGPSLVNKPVITEDELDDENPAVALIKQELAGHEITNEAVFEAVRDIDSVVIGDVDTCRKKIAKFKDAGFDRLLCMQQYGELSHEEILKSTARLGAEIVPYFAEKA